MFHLKIPAPWFLGKLDYLLPQPPKRWATVLTFILGYRLSNVIQNLVSHLSQEVGGQQDFRDLLVFGFFSAIVVYQMPLHQFLTLCISPPVNIGSAPSLCTSSPVFNFAGRHFTQMQVSNAHRDFDWFGLRALTGDSPSCACQHGGLWFLHVHLHTHTRDAQSFGKCRHFSNHRTHWSDFPAFSCHLPSTKSLGFERIPKNTKPNSADIDRYLLGPAQSCATSRSGTWFPSDIAGRTEICRELQQKLFLLRQVLPWVHILCLHNNNQSDK